MMFRVLLFVVLLLLVLREINRLFARSRGTGPSTPTRDGRSCPPAAPPGELMVRDPVCGTFVVPSRALSYRDKHGTQCFCSDTCRQAYVSRPGSA